MGARASVAVDTPTAAGASTASGEGEPMTAATATGFHVFNLTGYELLGEIVGGDASLAAHPPMWNQTHLAALDPGEMHDFTFSYDLFSTRTYQVRYQVSDPADRSHKGYFTVSMRVDGFTHVPSRTVDTTDGLVSSGNGMDLLLIDAEGVVTNPRGQNSMLRSLCNNGLADCLFRLQKREPAWSAERDVLRTPVAGVDAPESTVYPLTSVNEFVSSSGFAPGYPSPVFDAVAAATWSSWRIILNPTDPHTEHRGIETYPGASAIISAVRPVHRDTGELIVTREGRSWVLPMSFDSPDYSRQGIWNVYVVPPGSPDSARRLMRSMPMDR